ncbi:MAG: hypothetical protein KDA79_06895 [Planctomycetaceae bacterium]|nr:hypothetical protein [Planctomycetaceae bacterium]
MPEWHHTPTARKKLHVEQQEQPDLSRHFRRMPPVSPGEDPPDHGPRVDWIRHSAPAGSLELRKLADGWLP